MNPESENFEQLRRLLALKRHEQPPPGYFSHFSGDVIAAIRAGAHRQSWVERLLDEAPWLRRFWEVFESKPIGIGFFGTSVCGLLLLGLLYSGEPGTAPPEIPGLAQSSSAVPVASAAHALALNDASHSQLVSSTNGIAPGGSLFDQ